MNGMPKRSGKGRISNNLVAASCAAVLTVYAAGYWRTRDAARQFDMQAKGRRAGARTHPTAAIAATPAVTEPVSPAAQPPLPAPYTSAAAAVSAQGRSPPVAGRRATRARAATATDTAVTPATSSSTVAATENMPASAATGIVVHPVPMTPEPVPPPLSESGPPATPAARWRDGAYTGHGDSPHGDLDVRVVIKEGRIIEASIEACNTRYPCEVIDRMVRQAVLIQSSNVDYMSRATESSEAYFEGLSEALNTALYQSPGKEAASQ